MKILFLHGWHSVPGGVKPTYLKDHGHEIINPALDDDNFDAALAMAQAEFDHHRPAVVVGSSRGGAIAMNLNSGDVGLVLLCPAWKNWGSVKTVKPGTVILHSRADEVIPFADSETLAKNSGLPEYSLIEVGRDHRLADRKSLEAMLGACTRRPEANSIIELHDSRVVGIDSRENSIVVGLGPAYIHRSAGRPGFDQGSGWVQDVDLIFDKAVVENGFAEMPSQLDGGFLSVGGDVFDNLIPFPIDASGDVRVSLENRMGEKLVITASRIRLRAVGKSQYVEEF